MNKNDYKGIWVFAEQQNGVLSEVTFEIFAKSLELKDSIGGDVTAVILGDNVAGLAGACFSHGAEKVIVAEHPNLKEYSTRPYGKVLTELCEKHKPAAFLFGATTLGRDLAPRVMVNLRTGLTADAVDLSIDEDGDFVQTTPGFGGKILAHIWIGECRPQMATVHPGVFAALEPKTGATGEVIYETVEAEADTDFEVLETLPKVQTEKPINEAKVLISGGRGIKSQEDISMLRELAVLMEGQLACSRPLVDAGWLPHELQIGQSGTTVKPDFILNVGVSGSVQYMSGMQDSSCIASINKDGNADIFDLSSYGAVADYKQILPKIIAEIRSRKG